MGEKISVEFPFESKFIDVKESMKNLKMIELGEGLHFIQEDYPHEIGEEIQKWHAGIINHKG